MSDIKYHIGFGADDIAGIDIALLSGDPVRAEKIATQYLTLEKPLSVVRGLNSYVGTTPGGKRIVSATSGMGAPSLSIVANELAQVGIRHIIRIGTCGSIQPHVLSGSVVITRAALCRQGAAHDIAPAEYPAAANPFWTMALVDAARDIGADWHVGITASVDTFYEGQERTDTSYNKHLLRERVGAIDEYQNLRVLNFEMEAGTLFKLANVYGLGAACICGVIAARVEAENVSHDAKVKAEDHAIRIAIAAVDGIDPALLGEAYRW
ncbi:MAG: nucleoside phosphorylase [Anaerolineae bacterium]|nr:nucleoside phosphorylase [Anaerolineae bacterium]